MGQHLPGYEVGRAVTMREVLLSTAGTILLPVVIDGNLGTDGGNTNYTYEIRAGWPIGRLTASGRFVPCKRTIANGAGSSTATLVVNNAAPFRVGDTIKVAANANVAINAINYGTNTITIASAQTWANGAEVRAQDGSETCRGILLDSVKLRNDDNTAPVHRSASMLIQGAVRVSMLLGDVAALRADAAAKLAGIRFSDEHGS